MSIREKIIDYSRGNDLSRFWRLYRRQQRAKSGFRRDVLTFLMSRCAARHGGYIGPDAVIRGVPSLPHGLHGVFISRYAVIGANCRIYQNVTIGEIAGKAPEIGDGASSARARCSSAASVSVPARRSVRGPSYTRMYRRAPRSCRPVHASSKGASRDGRGYLPRVAGAQRRGARAQRFGFARRAAAGGAS